ncbi:hypothetical protein [Haloarchaeobius sp. DFWS5]|uniref:hypothetical protein n=1 Tax=Haloarchaeobius sp. DFWS5 TaxID=3446114 RepID=UPI003EBD151B
MHRADAVLTTIPTVALGGLLIERSLQTTAMDSAVGLEWVQFTVLGLCLAFVVILHEVIRAPALE